MDDKNLMYIRRRVFDSTFFDIDGTKTLTLKNTSVTAAKVNDSGLKTNNLSAVTEAGAILATMNSSVPIGFSICSGAIQSLSAYSVTAAAFARTAVNASANDSVWYPSTSLTSYYKPDLRGRVLVGTAAAASRITIDATTGSFLNPKSVSSNASVVATSFGEATNTLVIANWPAHTHGVTVAGVSHRHAFSDFYPDAVTATTGLALSNTYGITPEISANIGSASNSAAVTLDNAGSASSHTNLTKVMTVDFIIRSEWIDI